MTDPFLVEARDWARLPERFHREIERGYVVLAESEGDDAGSEWHEVPVSKVAIAVIGETPARSAAECWGGGLYRDSPHRFSPRLTARLPRLPLKEGVIGAWTAPALTSTAWTRRLRRCSPTASSIRNWGKYWRGGGLAFWTT